jgi:phage tail-like protein
VPLATDVNLGLSNRFSVTVDPGKFELGSFGKAEGLDVTWEMPDYRAGDAGNYRWFAPGLTKYSTVKLSRSVSAEDTPKVKKWLEANSKKFEVWLITIDLKDAKLDSVMKWECENAIPLKWSVQSFDASASKIAIETLEFSHLGFLDDHMK